MVQHSCTAAALQTTDEIDAAAQTRVVLKVDRGSVAQRACLCYMEVHLRGLYLGSASRCIKTEPLHPIIPGHLVHVLFCLSRLRSELIVCLASYFFLVLKPGQDISSLTDPIHSTIHSQQPQVAVALLIVCVSTLPQSFIRCQSSPYLSPSYRGRCSQNSNSLNLKNKRRQVVFVTPPFTLD